ncbi:hypothetical protein FKM82_015218 [Ascaphus truei]
MTCKIIKGQEKYKQTQRTTRTNNTRNTLTRPQGLLYWVYIVSASAALKPYPDLIKQLTHPNLRITFNSYVPTGFHVIVKFVTQNFYKSHRNILMKYHLHFSKNPPYRCTHYICQ